MTTTWGTEIPKREVDPDEVVFLAERRAKLAALTEHPSWQELRQVMEERREAWEKRLARKITKGTVTAKELEMHAGYWAGVFAVLDKPDEVEKDLQRKLRKLDTADDSAQEGET